MLDHTRLDLSDLASQSTILPMYGSTATTASVDQRAANRSIYGVETPAEIIEALRPGGVVLVERIPFHPRYAELPLGSLGDSARLQDYVGGLQSVAEQHDIGPLLIIADQEGGTVNRLPVPPLSAPALIGATGRLDLAEQAARLTGLAARHHGVNLVLGPVADIVAPGQPAPPPIGERSFGADPAHVAAMVAATIRGLHAGGVMAAAKHWPGHGRATADSHVQLPTLAIGRDEWLTHEAQPFVAAISEGVDAILSAHLIAPAVDEQNQPASISSNAMGPVSYTHLTLPTTPYV